MARTPRKRHSLSPDALRGLFDYNPDTGALTWRPRSDSTCGRSAVKWNERWAGRAAGYICKTQGYAMVTIFGGNHGVHRIGWAIATGEWPRNQIDHIDGDRLNNRLANLREVTNSQNQMNRRKRIGCALPRGVCRTKSGRYKAAITLNGRKINLGGFATPEDAYSAYCDAAKRLHGEYTNVP